MAGRGRGAFCSGGFTASGGEEGPEPVDGSDAVVLFAGGEGDRPLGRVGDGCGSGVGLERSGGGEARVIADPGRGHLDSRVDAVGCGGRGESQSLISSASALRRPASTGLPTQCRYDTSSVLVDLLDQRRAEVSVVFAERGQALWWSIWPWCRVTLEGKEPAYAASP